MKRTASAMIVLALVSMTVLAERTRLRPGRNMFSPQQDIEMGREVAKDAEKQLVMISHGDANAYISALGQQLVARAPNENKFPFTFKIVNDRSINAFALPGGAIYVHRGAIETADNEAQLAGVIGHEIGHVILRHGTNQVTKAQIAQAPLAILGGILGNDGLGRVMTELGGFAAGSILLRYSRDAETESDLMGTQILYDAGYGPRAMAEFFEKLAKEHKGSRTEQFFSNHPIPENRIAKVNAEIGRIGAVPANARTDSPDFQTIKQVMLAMPEPPKAAPKPAGASTGDKPSAPRAPSTRMTSFQISGIQLRHPDNWKPAVQGTNITLAPDGGIISGNLAYGMIIDTFRPQAARNLDQATTQFLESLRKGNPAMKVVRRAQARVDGQTAQLTELTNDSPAGGQETDAVITLLRSSGELLYFVEVVPTKDIAQYRGSFQAIMDSVRLR